MLKFVSNRSHAGSLAKTLSPGSRIFMSVAGGLSLLLIASCNEGRSQDVPTVAASPKTLEQRFAEKSANAAAEASPSPNALSESPAAEDAPPVLISETDAKALRKEFRKKLSQELDALKAEQRRTARENSASRKQRQRDWNKNEQRARRKFFEENLKGADRRAYILDFIERRKALKEMLKNEEKTEKNELAARRRSFEQDQAARLKEFQDHLTRGVRPPESLWNR